MGHTEYLCIADCGLPIPKGTKTVDISLTAGIPGFLDVLQAVNTELVTEQAIVASEIDAVNPAAVAVADIRLGGIIGAAVCGGRLFSAGDHHKEHTKDYRKAVKK